MRIEEKKKNGKQRTRTHQKKIARGKFDPYKYFIVLLHKDI